MKKYKVIVWGLEASGRYAANNDPIQESLELVCADVDRKGRKGGKSLVHDGLG